MSLASDFFDSSCSYHNGSLEDTINFFIDNYPTVMSRWRMMNKQNDALHQRKLDAKKALDQLLKEKVRIKRNKVNLSDAQKLELAEMENFYKEVLRSTEIAVDRDGEPIEHDYVTYFILKHQRFFNGIDKTDRKAREGIGIAAEKGATGFLWPLKKMLFETMVHTENNDVNELLETGFSMIDSLPKNLRDAIDLD